MSVSGGKTDAATRIVPVHPVLRKLIDHLISKSTDGFILRDFQLKEGQFGIFVEGPQKPCKPFTTKEGKIKEWTDVVSIYGKKGLKEELIQMASEAYDPNGEVRSKGGTTTTVQVDDLDDIKDLNLAF